MTAGAGDERERVLAFRASGHNLARRLPRKRLVDAVAAVGVRDMRSSAATALHARVSAFAPNDIAAAIDADDIVRVPSARGNQTLVPRTDAAVFTIGTLPADDASLRTRLKPFLPVLDRSGHSAVDALARAVDVARETLARGPVDIGVLSGALTSRLPELSPMCRGRCGVAHIDAGLFDLTGESGLWHTRDEDGTRLYLPLDLPQVDRVAARAELVRRYLRCHGPSTATDFAAWCGISRQDAQASLSAVAIAVFDRNYLMSADSRAFERSKRPAGSGARFLPPADPYLLGMDRETIVPDAAARKRVWKPTPTDGLVLVDGEPVATWRPKKARKVLQLKLEPVVPLGREMRGVIEEEAESLATLRGCAEASVTFG